MTLVVSWVTVLTCFAAWHYRVPGMPLLSAAFAFHELMTYGLWRYPQYRVRWHTGQLIMATCCAGLSAYGVAHTGNHRLSVLYGLSWYFWLLQWSYVGKALMYSAFLGLLRISASHQMFMVFDRIMTIIEQQAGTFTTLSDEDLAARAPLRHGRDCRHEVESCTICCEDVTPTDLHRHLPGCDHIFHAVCVDTWLLQRSATCPICRSSVS